MPIAHIPTPTVGSWRVVLSDSQEAGELTLTSDDDGRVTGTLEGGKIFGLWDPDASKVTFLRFTDPTDPTATQVFTGYLSSRVQGVDQIANTLTGHYQAFVGAGVTAQRNTFGWTASMTRIA
jgi:hypothetical protein